MRPLKELLQILLDEVEMYGITLGLCYEIKNMYFFGDINGWEHELLTNWIGSFERKEGWLFPKGETAPRIEFLKNEIEKL